MDQNAKPTILLLVGRSPLTGCSLSPSLHFGEVFFFVSCTALGTACLLHFILLYPQYGLSDIDTQQYVWPDNKELKPTFFPIVFARWCHNNK